MTQFFVKALLAATALMPVAAMAQDNGGHNNRGDRGGARQQRSEAARPQRQERAPQQQGQARPQQAPGFQVQRQGRPDVARNRGNFQPNPQRQQFRQERRQDRQQFGQERRDDRQGFRQERRDDRQQLRDGQVTRPEFRADRQNDRRDFRADRRGDRQDFRQDRRNDVQAFDRNRARQQYGRNNGWQNNDRRYGNRGGWNRGWRSDNRYDYARYRSINRNVFHLPRYYAPYGWDGGYRRFSIGFSLNSVLFGENYWIEDPGYYRLPPVDYPYQWVRYYNDALLVDTETGEVVDTVYDIFW